jgi:hypothetical protein
MKDVISILQSRIANRENEIAIFESGVYEGRLTLIDGGYVEARPLIRILAKQQKEDKRVLAEIVKLRRVAKIVKRQEAIMVALVSVYEPAEVKLPKDFVELIRLGER